MQIAFIPRMSQLFPLVHLPKPQTANCDTRSSWAGVSQGQLSERNSSLEEVHLHVLAAAAAAASRSLVCRLAMWFFFHVCRTLYGIHRFVGTIRFSVQSLRAFGMLEKSSFPPRTTRWKSLFPPQLELFFFLLLHFAYCTIFPSAVGWFC